jgi:hypothetical protein
MMVCSGFVHSAAAQSGYFEGKGAPTMEVPWVSSFGCCAAGLRQRQRRANDGCALDLSIRLLRRRAYVKGKGAPTMDGLPVCSSA